jgi:hypothetical protein
MMTSREAKYNVWAGNKLDICVMEHSCMYLFNFLIILHLSTFYIVYIVVWHSLFVGAVLFLFV